MDYQHMDQLDELDTAILNELQHNGRLSNAELARRINLSPPATHARLRQLEERGYIQHYAAILNRERLGYDMLCLILIGIQQQQSAAVEQFQKRVRRLPEVLECYQTTGEFDFVLKVVIRDRQDLERFLTKRLSAIPNIARIQTTLVIREVKSTTVLPLDQQ